MVQLGRFLPSVFPNISTTIVSGKTTPETVLLEINRNNKDLP